MTELMKRYEAETGEKAKKKVLVMYSTKRYGWGREKNHLFFTNKFVKWFKDKYDALKTEVLDGKTIEKFQEIIRNQCDEISALKAQLTWRPVSDPPKVDDQYLCRWEGTGRFVALYKNKVWFIWDDELEEYVKLVHLPYMWLPIPPALEGVIV